MTTADRVGDWMQTFGGRQFWPLDPRAEDIFIEDIAHGLSLQCRYGGHCLRFYSVAEHSVLIAKWLSDRGFSNDICLWGLLHDAAEAYVLDIIRPIKGSLPGYRDIEDQVMVAVCQRFGLDYIADPFTMPSAVKAADNRILVDEKQQNMAPGLAWGIDSLEPLGVTLQLWSPEQAKAEFLQEFRNLIK